MTTIVHTPQGRKLAVEEWGSPTGRPVFLLHGTPGSRLGPRPRAPVLYRLGVRLITFDRPGYGGSDPARGRRVSDAVDDVSAVADALGLDTFAVVGRSGGGPHALACAALLPERTSKAAVLVGLAPRTAEGLDWFDGMAESNVVEYSAASAGYDVIAERLGQAAARIRANPAQLVAGLFHELPEADRRVVADDGIRKMLWRNFAEGLRHSADGWVDDAMAFTRPWGFDPAVIETPTLLWHGEDDVFSPVAHCRWLGERIPGSVMAVEPGAAHFGALSVLPDVLRWLVTSAGVRDPC
ncbi:alpha/beta fold hydrolase [Nonomuraea mangrovi]|uniref:Alpha/beta fold hydrolase n=1 Tax=Nonomuraea mangrovi TaxID=2316207 RepID=A0ABW4TC41_9ACTN